MIRSILCCFSILFLLSCKQASNEGTSEQTSSPAFSPGKTTSFATTDGVGTMDITFADESKFSFYITVATSNANCVGELEGIAKKENGVFTYQGENSDCHLTFQVNRDNIVIEETGSECDHGAHCSFAGTYQVGTSEKAAQKAEPIAEPSTIEEYYMALPNEYLTCELEETYTDKQRRDFIKYKNNKAGYLKFATAELNEVELALFVDKASGKKFLAYVYECGAGCMCTRREFLSYENGEWNNIFDSAFPSLEPADDETELDFQLPEKGTDIIVKGAKDDVVLQWKDGKFTAK